MSDNTMAKDIYKWLDDRAERINNTPSEGYCDSISLPSIESISDEDFKDSKLARKWLNALDVSIALEYMSDLMHLVTRLGSYITPEGKDDTVFNGLVDELLDLLCDTTTHTQLEYIPEFKNIIVKALDLKYTLAELRGLK